jgi:hypothetical protein
MTHTLQILPAIGCIAMMFGMGAIGRLLRRTPLVRTILRRTPTSREQIGQPAA